MSGARRLAKRAFRAAERRFLVEGPPGVTEALTAVENGDPSALLDLLVTPEAARRHGDLLARAAAVGVPAQQVSPAVMAALAQTITPQGLLGVSAFRDVPLTGVLGGTPPARLVAVLAAVRDPGNAGTVLRVADAAGADAVVFTDSSVDPYNAKCVRASAGSIFHLPLVVGVPADAAVTSLRAAGARVLAADSAADTDLNRFADAGGLAEATAWVFGNEAWGLPQPVLDGVDVVVKIPVYGRAESLNLATAAAVCLYASARAQRAPGGCRAG